MTGRWGLLPALAWCASTRRDALRASGIAAAHKLFARQPHGALGALAVGPSREHHLALSHRLDSLIADGCAMRVAAQVLQHLRRAAQWRLGIDHPIVLVELALARSPGGGLALRVKLKFARLVRCRQRRHKLATKHLRQRSDRKQEVWLARRRTPAAVFGQHAASHHAMNMQVHRQLLRPGVQHQAEGRLAMGHAHPLRVDGELAERLGRTGKQGINQPTRVCAVEAVQTVRQCEHQMRVGHVEYLGQSPLQPGVFRPCAALRAMAVAA